MMLINIVFLSEKIIFNVSMVTIPFTMVTEGRVFKPGVTNETHNFCTISTISVTNILVITAVLITWGLFKLYKYSNVLRYHEVMK